MGKSRVPDIRFCGFTDDWEQREFSEITYPAGKKNRDNLPLESYSITNENGFVPQNEKFENGGTMRDADKRMYYIVEPHSFAYNPARINVGSIGYQDLEKNVIVSSLYEVFQTTDEIDDRFLWHWFKSPDFNKLIEQLQEGGVRLYFYYDKLCMGTFSFPKIEEQHQIGEFLDNLDRLITLHKQELDLLKQMKQGFLQKMFPKEGESVPEIRFPGFTDDWIEQTLYDMADNIDYGLNAAAINYDGIHKYIRITDIDDITRDFVLVSLTSPDIDYLEAESYILKPGDILFARTGASTGKSYIYKSEDGLVYFAGFLIRAQIKAEHNAEFVFQNTLTENYNNYIKVTSQRSGQPGVNAQEYGKFKLMAPSLTEQIVIGRFFRQIDCLIKENQQELELLKETKKAFLQKIFI